MLSHEDRRVGVVPGVAGEIGNPTEHVLEDIGVAIRVAERRDAR